MQALSDTDTLLELFRANPDVLAALSRFGISSVAYSPVSAAEVIVGVSNKLGLKHAQAALVAYPQKAITEPVFTDALDLLIRYNLSHGLELNDALVAATARHYDLPLFTLNLKHFRYISGLKLLPHSIKPKRGGWIFLS